MINVYDATDERMKEVINLKNEEFIVLKKSWKALIDDLVLVRATNVFPANGIVNAIDINEETGQTSSNWTLNGINIEGKGFIIIEPFTEQINNPSLTNIYELDTWFTGDVKLSKKAIVLISEETYRMLCNNAEFKEQADKMNIALYRGDERVALKMLLYVRRFASLDFDENGFIPVDTFGDTAEFIEQLRIVEQDVVNGFQKMGFNVTYGKTQKFFEDDSLQSQEKRNFNWNDQIEEEHLYIENIKDLYSKMITGLTTVVEGDIELDGQCFATTTIGKVRDNQEDAMLLIKDKKIPGLKMMVVADGMGGAKKGEVASHIVVTKLKEWFEELSEEEKNEYYSDISSIEEDIKTKIQEISFDIDWHLHGLGGTTMVCAIIGKSNTLIANVGDSRAYIVNNGELRQVSTEDSIVQEKFEEGRIPFKDAMRFHKESSGITQAVGMGLIDNIHINILNNEYQTLLLLSDGVTDCLSEEEIANICNTTNDASIAKMLVKKANENNSFAPEDLFDEEGYGLVTLGGKDNTTAISYDQSKRIEDDDDLER